MFLYLVLASFLAAVNRSVLLSRSLNPIIRGLISSLIKKATHQNTKQAKQILLQLIRAKNVTETFGNCGKSAIK